MTEITPQERMRRSLTLVLQRLAVPGTQARLADSAGLSESTVSRIKSDRLEDVLTMLAYLDLKVVDASATCVPRAKYEQMEAMATTLMQKAPRLYFEDELE